MRWNKRTMVQRLVGLLLALMLVLTLPGCGLLNWMSNSEGDESMDIAEKVVLSDKEFKEGALAHMQEKYGEEFVLAEGSAGNVDNVYAGRGVQVYPVAYA